MKSTQKWNFIPIKILLYINSISICIISSMNTISFPHKVYSYLFIHKVNCICHEFHLWTFTYINNSVHDHFIQMTWFTQEYSFISAIAFLWWLSIVNKVSSIWYPFIAEIVFDFIHVGKFSFLPQPFLPCSSFSFHLPAPRRLAFWERRREERKIRVLSRAPRCAHKKSRSKRLGFCREQE